MLLPIFLLIYLLHVCANLLLLVLCVFIDDSLLIFIFIVSLINLLTSLLVKLIVSIINRIVINPYLYVVQS